MKKTTMQDIADAIGISRISVWKAFHDYPGISARLKEEIFLKAKEMGYLKNNITSTLPPDQEKEAEQTVSVIVSRPDSSKFWMDIIHQIAKELNKYNINLMYTYVPTQRKGNYQLPAILTSGQIAGAIVLNVNDPEMTKLINQLNIPLVFLDIPPQTKPESLKGDLVLIEGRSATQRLTAHILAKGRSRIGFIGDMLPALSGGLGCIVFFDRWLKASESSQTLPPFFEKLLEFEQFIGFFCLIAGTAHLLFSQAVLL